MEYGDITNTHWDIVVIGTGMAGATCGMALAKAGLRVLFCERGKSYLKNPDAVTGAYAESLVKPLEPLRGDRHRVLLENAGRYYADIVDASSTSHNRLLPLMGCGTGGSSALYGAGLMRFLPDDFTPGRFFPDAKDGSVPEAWPVTYDEMRPWYKRAEQLYGVRGELDPLNLEHLDPVKPPLPLTPAAKELQAILKSNGNSPFSVPIACEYKDDCARCKCFLCPSNCKNDSAKTCLSPALENYNAALIDECYALRFEADKEQVQGVQCVYKGKEITIRGDRYILAAGALETPALLLRSRSSAWPSGLANDSKLVGKYLMRHYVDLFLVFPKDKDGCNSDKGVIAFNDHYIDAGAKYGNVQSFGLMHPDLFVSGVQKSFSDSAISWLYPAFRVVRPLLKSMAKNIFERAYIFTSIMEDRPWIENCVYPTNDKQGVTIRYRAHAGDRIRLKTFREKIIGSFAPCRVIPLYTADDNSFLSHACGTCRAGDDPGTSVIDKNNNAHGLENLYIIDASFFPSSAGINPSLTIAANALRVADAIVSQESGGT